MSRFWPHTDYAEHQPLSRTIPTVHVLDRAFRTGRIIGLGIGGVRSLIRRVSLATALAPTGYGALVFTGLMIPGLPAYMWNNSDIEWQDRSWRLLENGGQKEVDGFSHVGSVGGLLAAARSPVVRQGGKLSFVRLAGGAAVGNLVGVVAYMAWRYGVHRGKWPAKTLQDD